VSLEFGLDTFFLGLSKKTNNIQPIEKRNGSIWISVSTLAMAHWGQQPPLGALDLAKGLIAFVVIQQGLKGIMAGDLRLQGFVICLVYQQSFGRSEPSSAV
jgi:hypothetical protein